MDKMMNSYEKAVKETYEKVPIHELINFDKKPKNPVKVSIVIPVCNVETYLRECLDSAVNQTLKDIEIICVNDGSTDGSLAILKEYAEKDERVKIINKDNAGYGHTMNIGMDMATGEYIGILESDDYTHPNMYEDLYNVANDKKVEFVKADFYRFITLENGKKELTRINVGYGKYYDKILNPSENPELFKLNMQTWTGIYSRDYLNAHLIRHNETPGASYQDNGFYFKTYCWAKKIYLVNSPYYMYRYDNPNSSVHDVKKANCIKKEFDLIYDYINTFKNLPEKTIYLFYWKKYKSYLFTLNRISTELKHDFLISFSSEFKEIREKGGLRQELFIASDWRIINWIIDDPEDYYIYRVKTPAISVLIPAYNVQDYVRQCLDSVISQTLKNVEVICIDDGSKDSTLKILREYEAKYKNIIVYNQRNIGVGKTRNKAIGYARGEFVIFLDPDDWYPENDVLESLYCAAKRNNVKICGGSFSDYINGKIITEYKGTLKDYTFKEDGLMTYDDYQFDFGFHRFIYDREMLVNNKIYFPEYSRFQDPPFFISAMLCAKEFYALKKVVYRYRRSGENKVNWDLKKTTDLLRGLLTDLEISSQNKLSKLYSLTVKRFNVQKNYSIAIIKHISDKAVLQLLEQISDKIDHDLLRLIDEDVSKNYIYEILIKKEIDQNEELLQKNKKLESEQKNNNVSYAIQQLNITLKDFVQKNQIMQVEEINSLKNDRIILGEIRSSFSYKIGLFITFIPRKIRSIKYLVKKF